MIEKFTKLIEIVRTLRSPDGCPWDREQNLLSIKNHFMEEAFELVDALDNEDIDNIREELGDVFFHVIFHAVMAEEEGKFSMEDVLNEINEKLIRRHPHVFGNLGEINTDQVIINWDKIKSEEKKAKRKSALDDIPASFPSMQRSMKMQERVKKVGFDWPDMHGCMDKFNEEINEFKEAVATGSKDEIEHEMGDVFFSLINLSRFLKINPDEALRRANSRFHKRFTYIEQTLQEKGLCSEDATLEQMEELWQEAKNQE
ncbi:MazG family protein [Denitrovibrio acetiphilus DSM 12809]|jgi:tetrapyrrole methylase family protein/MazG family protein|uniref:Nucleoside triphosphate pyrophosphohydrolase n=1 Tax=Denitrovibrio acetiphilus (strain DSM 12809 / NBRC 114555 / N2460) TaxID=522772 RepID=D4H2V2_DENA2|nr:nucleoside triphosphate pyrophosphohydrolase [Denitrovibrio acetiphilus]ADD68975.1 MazG family protein [Denitrovibrio acetiphilus DSM 12809]